MINERNILRHFIRNFAFTFRYDIVCHLVTAAEGAEEFYTTENNTGVAFWIFILSLQVID